MGPEQQGTPTSDVDAALKRLVEAKQSSTGGVSGQPGSVQAETGTGEAVAEESGIGEVTDEPVSQDLGDLTDEQMQRAVAAGQAEVRGLPVVRPARTEPAGEPAGSEPESVTTLHPGSVAPQPEPSGPEPTDDEELREQAIKDARESLEYRISKFGEWRQQPGNENARFNAWLELLNDPAAFMNRVIDAPRLINARVTPQDLERYKEVFDPRDYSDLYEHLYLVLKAMKEESRVPTVRIRQTDGNFREIQSPEDKGWRDELLEYLEKSRRPEEPLQLTSEESELRAKESTRSRFNFWLNRADEFLGKNRKARIDFANGKSYLPNLFKTFKDDDFLFLGYGPGQLPQGNETAKVRQIEKLVEGFVEDIPFDLDVLDIKPDDPLLMDVLACLTPDEATEVIKALGRRHGLIV